MTSIYKQQLKTWVATLDVYADTVLDIGGSQDPIKGRTKSWHVKEYLIADLPEPHIDSPKPDIELDLNLPSGDVPEFLQFDMIFCLEVFDYIYDPCEAFKTLYKYLKAGGTAWVTFPSFYPLHQPVEDDALRYMEGGIRKLADLVGLNIEEIIKRRPETNYLNTFWAAERMRAAKHEDHNYTGFIVKFTK